MAENKQTAEPRNPRSQDGDSPKDNAAVERAMSPSSSSAHSETALIQRPAKGKKTKIGSTVAVIVIVALALGLGLGLGLRRDDPTEDHVVRNKGPNVLLFMSDDQDKALGSMDVMPKVRKLLGEQGVTYDKHYCTVAWCCPSRVNLFTGRAAHNTNVTSAQPPDGGWPKFNKVGLAGKYLPVYLQEAGISTYYVGKFMNGFKNWNFADPEPPRGWTDSSILVEPWTYNYYNSHWTNKVNATSQKNDISSEKGNHTTDVAERKALRMLDDAAQRDGQFFMMVAPVAPHAQLGADTQIPPVPPKWRGVFNDRQAPRGENFNPEAPSGASWIRNKARLTDDQIDFLDDVYSARLGNIAAIDDMVAKFVDRLEQYGMLENTYIVYTTDNGLHLGNHRLGCGKKTPYEEDINIPLVMRGPDVAQGITSNIVNSHTDMAPTILKMLDVPIQEKFQFDGAAIAYTADELGVRDKHELVNVEFWNSGHRTWGPNSTNTYKALRLLSDEYSFMYSTWCNGDHELYNMITDPSQMRNRLATPPDGIAAKYYGRTEEQLVDRLDALLMVSKSCSEDTCRNPWNVMFPDGRVNNLTEAMRSDYDSFFSNQPKVSFQSCIQNHYVDAEGPQDVNVYSG